MREFWGELIWSKEGAPGGKVTHWQVFFQPATNWDIQAGRAKRRATTTLILLRSLFQCKPPWSSSTKSEIAKCDAMTQVFIQECFTALTLNIEYITSQDVTLKLISGNLGFTMLFADLSFIYSHEGCVYMCPLQVTSQKRYLHLNEIKSYMSSVGAKYADIMA